MVEAAEGVTEVEVDIGGDMAIEDEVEGREEDTKSGRKHGTSSTKTYNSHTDHYLTCIDKT